MYSYLLFAHNLFRWLVLISLLCSIGIAYAGWTRKSAFSATANAFRHWTATIAHLQLVLGITLYFKSPAVSVEPFFRFIHPLLMIAAVVVVTIGSARAKRAPEDREKFQTMLRWFSFALFLILSAVPWWRPLFRIC